MAEKLNNLQIMIGIMICFFVAIAILYQVNNWYNLQDNFYYKVQKQINSNHHTAIVIGSSHVNVLNYTYIKEEISYNAPNFQIINLGKGADTFEKRVLEIDEIISLKPSIVFYGLDYFDFQNLARATNPVIINEQITHNEKLLPDVQTLFSYFPLKDTLGINHLNFKNPKLTTLTLSEEVLNKIKTIFDKNITNKIQKHNEEFEKLSNKTSSETLNKTSEQSNENTKNMPEKLNELEKLRKLATFEEIKADALRWGAGKPLYIEENNPNAVAFNEIIQKFNDAGIKVVIFTTPRNQLWWDGLSEIDKNSFFKIMDKISENYSIKIYYLHDKYFNLDIWADSHHVAMLPDGMIYTKDVSKIIISELTK
jgi:hypothetical protein